VPEEPLGGRLLAREGRNVIDIAAQVAAGAAIDRPPCQRSTAQEGVGGLVHRQLALDFMSALPGVDAQIVAFADRP
jgi:hypothetical protein